MDANNLILKLRADGLPTDEHRLDNVYKDFVKISNKLQEKDKSVFALNILCTLCRNLQKVPSWQDHIDKSVLLVLTLECAKVTTSLNKEERVKVLASIYHIHRYSVKQNVKPDLVLRLSHFPFENKYEDFSEYGKTYWAVLADRLSYIERLKTSNVDIGKMLPNCISHMKIVIKLYKTVPFCTDILHLYLKKMHFLFGDKYFSNLSTGFAEIFDRLQSKDDLRTVKDCNEDVVYGLFKNLNDAFVVVVEVALKCGSLKLDVVIKYMMAVFESKTDISYCLNTFYVNGFLNFLTDKPNTVFLEANLNNFDMSCEIAYKMGYERAMKHSYTFLYQTLRLYLDYTTKNFDKHTWLHSYTINIQRCYIKLLTVLMGKIENSEPIGGCDNCSLKSSLHDAVRLSFLYKNIIFTSLKYEMDIIELQSIVHEVINNQYKILDELKLKNCANVKKYEFKVQTDVHNTAIALYKAKLYMFSIELFNLCIRREISEQMDPKNISRGLYNLAICEVDAKLFSKALKNAFLSFVYALPDNIDVPKYMNLVIDAKSKAVTEGFDDNIQGISTLDACRMFQDELVGDVLKKVKFSSVLKHEYQSYGALWPSVAPISGVMMSLYDLVNGRDDGWLSVEPVQDVIDILYDIMVDMPNVVRSINCPNIQKIVVDIVLKLENKQNKSLKENLIYATLLLLKAEYDMTEGSQKYGWSTQEQFSDIDQFETNKTFEQEHEVLSSCVRAVAVWTRILPDIMEVCDEITREVIGKSLRIAQVFVPVLLMYGHTSHGLQLSYICTQLAVLTGDMNAYASNVGLIATHAATDCDHVSELLEPVLTNFHQQYNQGCKETLLSCVCEAAIYFARTKKRALAARLVDFVQTVVVNAYETDRILYDTTIARILEAQDILCDNSLELSKMSSIANVQKHCFTLKNNETTWSARKYRSAFNRHLSLVAIERGVKLCNSLLLWRRARATASNVFRIAPVRYLASLFALTTNTHKKGDALVKIEGRLKPLLQPLTSHVGIQNCIQDLEKLTIQNNQSKLDAVETMLEARHFERINTSPSFVTTSVPAFKVPEFFGHSKPCRCFACANPHCHMLALEIAKLEASAFFRTNEIEIADNYFDGCQRMIACVEKKIIEHLIIVKQAGFEEFVVNLVSERLKVAFNALKVEILTENAFFELARGYHDRADELIINIQEIVDEYSAIDAYLVDAYTNLICAANKVKQARLAPKLDAIEIDFDNLNLSPNNKVEISEQKTPEQNITEAPSVATTKQIVDKNDIMHIKRKGKVLNLDEATSPEEEAKPKTRTKRTDFKTPLPKTWKPVPETITPRVTRSKPHILVTQVESSTRTPKANSDDTFATPKEDLFFTPMSSVKTYSSKPLKRQVVKNLEFHTPVAEKIEKNKLKQTEIGTIKGVRDKRSLRRATSPGKLECDSKHVDKSKIVDKSRKGLLKK